jgi:hypothetical protein
MPKHENPGKSYMNDMTKKELKMAKLLERGVVISDKISKLKDKKNKTEDEKRTLNLLSSELIEVHDELHKLHKKSK